MKSLVSLLAAAAIFEVSRAVPVQNIANGGPYLLNNLGINNLVPVGYPGNTNPTVVNGNCVPNTCANTRLEPIANANIINNAFIPTVTGNCVPNTCATARLEPISNANMINNAFIPTELVGGLAPNTIASTTSFMPNNLANLEVTNVQFTPLLTELMPSLQIGDISVTGDMPIGGTIKVRGCIPVYGMISLDGAVPSAGTAVVADLCDHQIANVASKCTNQLLS